MSKESVAQEAPKIVNGIKAKAYGEPLDMLNRLAALWLVVTGHVFSPEEVGLCLIQLKIARQINKSSRNNLVDIAGYALVLEKAGYAE